MALKDVLKAIKNPTVAIDDINKQLTFPSKQRTLNYFRPSTVVGECPVSMWYGFRKIKWSNPELEKGFSPQLMRIFQLGTDVHTEVQHWLGKSGHLWGLWKCPKCDKIHSKEFEFRPKEKCSCGGDWVYEEITMWNKEYNLLGHTDGIIKKNGLTYLFELKTMNSFKFTKLKEPEPIHIKQASIYSWLMETAHNVHIDKMVILYYSKNDSVLKEYVIDVDKSILKEATDVMKEVNESLKTGIRPKRICKAPINAKAVKCPFRDVCFDRVKEVKIKGE